MKKILLVALVLLIVFGICACQQNTKQPLTEEGVKRICEIAALKCSYNNVAKIKKEPDNIFQKEREMWIEYEGVVTLGIKMDELKMDVSANTVTIVLPKVCVLSAEIGQINADSYVVSADGWLIKNPITTEEQTEAVHKSQEEMKNKAENNAGLIAKAEEKVKQAIEYHINQIGQLNGQEYTIIWKEREA